MTLMEKIAFIQAHSDNPLGATPGARIAGAAKRDAGIAGAVGAIAGGIGGTVLSSGMSPIDRAKFILKGIGAGTLAGGAYGAYDGASGQGILETIEAGTGLKAGSGYWDGNKWTS